MPQPAVNDATAHLLIRVYERSQAAMVAEYQAIIDEPRSARRAARLREMLRSHEATMETLRGATTSWLAEALPGVYAAGAAATAEMLGGSFQWTMEHRAAVTDYAHRTWDDIAARLRDIDRDTRAAIRGGFRDATRATIVDGQTAQQAARAVAREAAQGGVYSVTYSNGAVHTMADYADSAIRTTTAESYNRGSVGQCVQEGIEWVQYADGTGCGVNGHNDGEEANGLIVKVEDVIYLSHPRCRRAILPAPFYLPDGTGVDDVDLGGERPPAEPVIAMREPRAERVARTPRTPRGGSGDE